MRFDADVIKTMLRPAWLILIVGSGLLAGLGALWVGLQQDAGETSTTYVFARRVGYLDRPIPVLDDHVNEIINSVEFPAVFIAIDERLLLEVGEDYDLSIGPAENTQSVVQIDVQTERPGEADRIARIVAEEMVSFVLDTQDVSIETEITDFDVELTRLSEEQTRLVELAGGVSPTVARRSLEAELTTLLDAQASPDTDDVDTPDDEAALAAYEADLRDRLTDVAPVAIEYERNASTMRGLERLRARAMVERIDITSSQESINDEWYRQVTPVEPSSPVPVAVAMAFAAAVPALVVAFLLVSVYVSRRLAVERKRVESEARMAQPASRGSAVRA